MIDKNAFPNITPDMEIQGGPGMSLREYYAGQALIGVIIADGAQYFDRPNDHAKVAVAHADAMLVALA